MDAINQEMLLGTNFLDEFDMGADLGNETRQVGEERKIYRFANVKNEPEEPL